MVGSKGRGEMLFSASPSLRLAHLRPAPRSWLAAFLLRCPGFSGSHARLRHPPPGTRRAVYPGRPPPFLSLPTHPTPFLFYFQTFFFFFKPPETAASNARGLDPAPVGAPTKPHSIPACMSGGTESEPGGQAHLRSSPRENRTKFPQRPSQAELAQINKDLTCPPPTQLRAISAFVSPWVTGWGGGGGDNTDRSGYLFSLLLNPFLPKSRLQAASSPRGSTAALEPPAPIHRAWLSHSLLIIFYKSNATQFFPHYREPWGGCPAIGGGDVTWAGSRGPERKKGVLFGVNLDSNSVIYQGIS